MNPNPEYQDFNDNRHDFPESPSQASHKPEIKNDASHGNSGNRFPPPGNSRSTRPTSASPQWEMLTEEESDAGGRSFAHRHYAKPDDKTSPRVPLSITDMCGLTTGINNTCISPTPVFSNNDEGKSCDDMNFSAEEDKSDLNNERECCGLSPLMPILMESKRSIPHSNSLSCREQMFAHLLDKQKGSGTLKKDYSFPTLSNQKPHHNVYSPSYKLTCTPTNDSIGSSSPDELFDYPINITTERFTFATDRMNINSICDKRTKLCVDLERTQGVARSHSDTEFKPMKTTVTLAQDGQSETPEQRDIIKGNNHSRDVNAIISKDLSEDTSTSADNLRSTTSNILNESDVSNIDHSMKVREEENSPKDVLSGDQTQGAFSIRHVPPKSNQILSNIESYEAATVIQHQVLSVDNTDVRSEGVGTDFISASDILSEAGDSKSTDHKATDGKSVDYKTEDTNSIGQSSRGNKSVDHNAQDASMKESKDHAVTCDKRTQSPKISKRSSAKGCRTTCRMMEIQHVHQVYKQIAPQCDHVRHKAWPKVKRFLKDLEPGSLVADIGCGNGRYLNVNPSIIKLGSDLCQPFLEQARGQSHEVMMADNIALPYRDATFDAVISIGVIHHFASLERRITALSELSRILSPGGKLMVYVWAFEQLHRKFENQDVLIPWVKPQTKDHARKSTMSASPEPDRASVSSIGSSPSEDDSSTSMYKRRRRQERRRNENSGTTKHRSRSAESKNSEPEDKDDECQSDDHFGQPKFGVFDRRDSKNKIRKGKLFRSGNVTGEDEGTAEDKPLMVTKEEILQLSSGEDPNAFAKWPGQLVSECRKLGKFLRSLSSKSDTHSNDSFDSRDAERKQSLTETIPGNRYVGGDAQNTAESVLEMEQDVKRTASDEDINDGAADNEDSNNSSEGKTADDSTPQFNLTQTKGNDNIASDCSYGSYGHIPTEGRESVDKCCCDVYDNNNIVPSAVATSYHNIQPTTTDSLYSTNTSISNQSLETHNTFIHTVQTCQSMDHNGSPNDNITECENNEAQLAYLQLPTPMLVSSSADESDGTSSGNLGSSTFTADMPNVSSAASFEPASATSPESVTSNGVLSPPSDHTVKNSITDKSHVPLSSSENIQNSNSSLYDPEMRSVSQTPPEIPSDRRLSLNVTGRRSSVRDQHGPVMISQLMYEKPYSETDNPINYFMRGDAGHLFASRSNTSTEVNFAASDLADSTDCLDSDSVFSFDQDRMAHRDSLPRPNSDGSAHIHPWSAEGKPIPLRRAIVERVERDAKTVIPGSITPTIEITSTLEEQTFEKESSTERNDALQLNNSTTQEAVSPVRLMFKNIFSKLADVFRIRNAGGGGYKSFGSYHDGKGPAQKYLLESDSSEIETTVSNISTHSSVYPRPSADSNDKPGVGRFEERELYNTDNDVDDDTFELVNDNDVAQQRSQLTVDKANDKHHSIKIHNLPCQKFVDDASKSSDADKLRENPGAPGKSYIYRVEDLGQCTERTDSIFHFLGQKLSNILNKRRSSSENEEYQHYSPVSFSTSEDEEDVLRISLLSNEKIISSPKRPVHKVFTKRPSSLDFTKKRTRGKGRRPPPTGETRVKTRDENRLTLAEAMTLIGDGATEESVVKRLDDSAQTVFAEMKRMNFAIREFPRSSIDSDSNDDPAKSKPVCQDEGGEGDRKETDQDILPAKPLALKMRYERRKSAARRRFSDSVTSQAVRSKRGRGMVQLQNEVNQNKKDRRKRDRPLPRQYFSEDLKASFDAFRLKRDDKPYWNLSQLQEQAADEHPETLEFQPFHNAGLSTVFQNFSNNAQTGSVQHHSDNTQSVTNQLSSPKTSKNKDNRDSASHHHDVTQTEGAPTGTSSSPVQEICYAVLVQGENVKENVERTKNLDRSRSEGEATRQKISPAQFKASHSLNNSYESQSPPSSTSCRKNGDVRQCNSHPHSDSKLSRYYHVFKKGELDGLVANHVPSLIIVDTFYDHANWCIIAQKQ